jgi:Fe-S cluster biogenesis protein NfuA
MLPDTLAPDLTNHSSLTVLKVVPALQADDGDVELVDMSVELNTQT